MVKRVDFKNFTATENQTWSQLFERQSKKRSEQIVESFSHGLRILGITAERIPDLSEVNSKLMAQTGFQGVPVEGLEEGASFFSLLAHRKFPVGNFIRDPRDLNYTPAPDVFHDLYGHLPFLVDRNYADFCQEFGIRACRSVRDPSSLRKFERLFWFTVEFGLIKTPQGKRIFGAGIASSFSECRYSLSEEPEVLPFDLLRIRDQEFRIDQIQPRLFLLENESQLYSCLDRFDALLTD